MAGLDPRFEPAGQSRTVTVEYLEELYGKADKLRAIEAILADPQPIAVMVRKIRDVLA